MRVCDICQSPATATMVISTLMDRVIYEEKTDLCESHVQLIKDLIAHNSPGESDKRKPGRPKKND
jgi:hypothetical protein